MDIEKKIEDHEGRIQSLEKADVKLFERIDSLIKQMQNLTSWIKWFIMALLASLGGFFIWYIQQ